MRHVTLLNVVYILLCLGAFALGRGLQTAHHEPPNAAPARYCLDAGEFRSCALSHDERRI